MLTSIPQLFLAFPVSHEFEKVLARVNPDLLTVFTQGGESYLEDRQIEGVRYLGKALGQLADLGAIDLLEENIYSLLERIDPHFAYRQQPLILIGAE